jgi:hypothetical protein
MHHPRHGSYAFANVITPDFVWKDLGESAFEG